MERVEVELESRRVEPSGVVGERPDQAVPGVVSQSLDDVPTPHVLDADDGDARHLIGQDQGIAIRTDGESIGRVQFDGRHQVGDADLSRFRRFTRQETQIFGSFPRPEHGRRQRRPGQIRIGRLRQHRSASQNREAGRNDENQSNQYGVFSAQGLFG